MATTQKIRNDIAKTKEKIAEQQKRLRALEAQLAEEENLEIVRMVKAVKMDNKELTAFLKAYASGMISLPEGMLQEGNTENEETEGYEDEAQLYDKNGIGSFGGGAQHCRFFCHRLCQRRRGKHGIRDRTGNGRGCF